MYLFIPHIWSDRLFDVEYGLIRNDLALINHDQVIVGHFGVVLLLFWFGGFKTLKCYEKWRLSDNY